MQFLDGQLIVSPSDLTGFLECEHLTQQELRAARGEIVRPERQDPEVADAKLARKAKAAAVLQCCVYAEQLAAVQGIDPEHITLILGDGTEEVLRLKDYGAYYRSVKRQFLEAISSSPSGGRQGGGLK